MAGNWYSTQSRAYQIYNKRKRVVVETIHVNFGELPHMASDYVSSDPVPQCKIVTTSNELDLLFSLMFDELLNGATPVVSKSSVIPAVDTPDQRQQNNTTTSNSTTITADIPPLNIQTTPKTTSQAPTQAPTITATENINQADTNKEKAQVEEDEFINIFSTPVQEQGETSSHQLRDTTSKKELTSKSHLLHLVDWKLFSYSLHGFVDLHHPNKVYRLKKALYGLKQTPGACVGTPMATKPLDADLSRTSLDQTKYRSMVGALMYLTVSSPDIIHATCYCARYQARPIEKHLREVKRVFRYLKKTINIGLWYPKDTDFNLTDFSDSDHVGCLDTRKSTSGGIPFLGGDKLVSWSSKKHECTSMFSAEAEYVSLFACCTQVLWLRTQLTDYGFHFDKISMYCDSKAAIAISCNPVQHSRTKNIDVRYHFIKEQVEKGIVKLFFVGTEYQLADMFTKALPEDRFKYLVRRLGMRCLTPEELEVQANESA
ncbi:hypothetical protein Tco_0655834 [Tanacetum coccineum]|uniref:Retrovirus-related Pol polyprotein from transposon TNT 1-94 n=1 Tax=Tanacetum coccineum TaxID=301880 RepID=A0ABQ4X732_9ASTR